MMKLIAHDDIVNANVSPLECYRWVEDTLARKDEVILPPKTALHLTDELYYNVMPSVFFDDGFAGVKVIQRHPNALPTLSSQIMLHDLKTGELKAVMDGSWITAMRTGAVAAHAVKHLAVDDFSTIGIMGLGNTGRAAMSVLLSLYPEREFAIKVLRYKNQHDLFISKYADKYPAAKFSVVDTPEEVVENSDVVISAITIAHEQIVGESLFKPGCLVVPIHLRGFMECDVHFDKVYCDDYAHVREFKHFGDFKYLAEMAEVQVGKKPGRQNSSERIIAYNVGLSIHDIYYAKQIYGILSNAIPDLHRLTPPASKYYI